MLDGGSQLQMRSRLQPVGLQLADLTAQQAAKLQPIFDQNGRLVDFSSRTNRNFTLKRKMTEYDTAADLEAEEAAISTADAIHAMENDRLIQPLRRSDRLSTHRQHSTATHPQPRVVVDDKQSLIPTHDVPEDETLVETAQMDTEAATDVIDAVTMLAQHLLLRDVLPTRDQLLDLAAGRPTLASEGTQIVTANAARQVHTADNPTPSSPGGRVETVYSEISGSIMKGYRMLISPEQQRSQG
jgi:hypothetical protein